MPAKGQTRLVGVSLPEEFVQDLQRHFPDEDISQIIATLARKGYAVWRRERGFDVDD